MTKHNYARGIADGPRGVYTGQCGYCLFWFVPTVLQTTLEGKLSCDYCQMSRRLALGD